MLKRLALAITALMLLLAACGGSGGGLSGEEKAKADEIYAELTADTSEGNPFADEADARCFADGIVGAIGLDRINELDTGEGLQAGFEDMTSAEQESVVDTAFDCIDFGALIEDQMAASGALSDDQMSCVSDGLTEDVLRGLFLAEIRGEDPAQNEALLGVVMDCMLGG